MIIYAKEFLSAIDLKLNDQIPVHYIKISLAAKTSNQKDDEENYGPEKQRPEAVTPLEKQQLLGAINTRDEFS